MARLGSRGELVYDNDGAAQPAAGAGDVMLRTIGVVVLLGIAVIHFAQIVATLNGAPLLGGAYVVLVAACVVVAGRLVTHGDRPGWLAAGLIGAGAIAGYVFTRIVGAPLDDQDVGNWACMLGLAALLVEASLLTCSAYALAARPASRAQAAPAAVSVEPPGRVAA